MPIRWHTLYCEPEPSGNSNAPCSSNISPQVPVVIITRAG